MMNRIGVIDIGTNSVRMTLAEVEESGYFRIIDELKENIKLGSDLVSYSSITEETLNLMLYTMKAYKSMCTSSGATKIFVVATEAIHQAKNESEFKEIISKELNLDVKILTNEEELHYNFLGAKNSLYTENSLMVDINGNTVHLAWIINNQVYKKHTLPFGYVTLTSQFSLGDIVCFDNNDKSVEYIQASLNDIEWLREGNFDSIIGIGGTFRNLGKIDRRRKRYPIDISHNYIFFDYDIDELFTLLKSKNLKQRQKIEGLTSNRADVIVAATSILNEILHFTKTEKIKTCGSGLREGILCEYLENHYDTPKDILDASLKGIMETLHVNEGHAQNVYYLTLKLFEGLAPLHKLDCKYKNILKTASLLHDCGISITYYDHHMHSFYVILNSYINGLEHKERLLSALCAAYHRNNSFQIPLAKYSSIINRLDVDAVEKIGVLLKIAEGLDRSLVGAVDDIKVIVNDDSVELKLLSANNLDLEIRQAYRSKSSFETVYKKKLIITK